jgi:hypothetical protein
MSPKPQDGWKGRPARPSVSKKSATRPWTFKEGHRPHGQRKPAQRGGIARLPLPGGPPGQIDDNEVVPF